MNTYKAFIKKCQNPSNYTVFVGLSGGVDSSTTAMLLKKAGFNVVGVFMQCYGLNDPKCTTNIDRKDAIKVAKALNIKIKIWNFEDDYKKSVIKYFFTEYKKGLTPNPDIYCNFYIKFNLFLNKCLKSGADFVATGHYAKVIKSKENYFIATPKDTSKDQSYFLSYINNKKLNKVFFPLGDYKKEEVRQIAKINNIPVANKKDSTGICFLSGVNTNEFLKTKIDQKEGSVIFNKTKKVIGKHKGVPFYTIGQRSGFSLNTYIGKPLFVLSKNIKDNTITVGFKNELSKNKITLTTKSISLNKESIKKQVSKKEVFLRIRNLGKFLVVSKIHFNKDQVMVYLKSSVLAVAPGQFGVLYKRLGGKKIVIYSGVIN